MEKKKTGQWDLAKFKAQFFAEAPPMDQRDIYLKRAFQQLLDNFPSILLSHYQHQRK